MSYYLFRAILSATAFSVCFAKSNITDFFGSSVLKRDCAFSHWGSWQGCHMTSSGTFEHIRTRSIMHPRGGGKPCPRVRVLSQTQTCPQAKVQAERFLLSLLRTEPASSKAPVDVHGVRQYGLTKLHPPCREWRDKNGKLILGDRNCKAPRLRNKRSAKALEARERQKRASGSTPRNMDLLLLLDESGRVGKSNFESTIKSLAKGIVRSLCHDRVLKPDKTRLSVVSFDKESHIHFFLKNAFMMDPEAAMQAIDGIKYSSSTDHVSCLDSALKHARTDIFQIARGARLDSESQKQIIVITDGCTTCSRTSLAETIDDLCKNKIAISTIFIGGDKRCLTTSPVMVWFNKALGADVIEGQSLLWTAESQCQRLGHTALTHSSLVWKLIESGEGKRHKMLDSILTGVMERCPTVR